MMNTFYDIDSSRFVFIPSQFIGSALERSLDKLVMHFASAALMVENKTIKTKDLYPPRYFLKKITKNEEVMKYLELVSSTAKATGNGPHPFESLIRVSEKIDFKRR